MTFSVTLGVKLRQLSPRTRPGWLGFDDSFDTFGTIGIDRKRFQKSKFG